MEQGSKKNCASAWKTPTSSGHLDYCTQRRGSCTVSSLGSWQKRQTTICYRFCTFPMLLFSFFPFFFPPPPSPQPRTDNRAWKTFTAILCPSFRSFRNLETCVSRKIDKIPIYELDRFLLHATEIEIVRALIRLFDFILEISLSLFWKNSATSGIF